MFIDAKIETNRLFIRPYQMVDAEDIYKMVQEPNHFRYMPDSPPEEMEDVKNLINWSMNCNSKNTKEKIYKFNLSIFLTETGEFIGVSGLGPNDLNPDEVEIYYSLLTNHQGKGYAKEAAHALLSFAFSTIKLEKVVGIVHPKNTASVSIIRGLGMKYYKELVGIEGEHEGFNGYDIYEMVNPLALKK